VSSSARLRGESRAVGGGQLGADGTSLGRRSARETAPRMGSGRHCARKLGKLAGALAPALHAAHGL
jgi:hypothetical protein